MYNKIYLRLSGGLLLLFLLLAAACTPSASSGGSGQQADEPEVGASTGHQEGEHNDGEGEDHDEAGHGDSGRIPNNGAAVRILSPSDGDTFKVGDEVIVEIEVENFTLGEGNHWHVYVDGSSWGMVMGGNRDEVLRGLSPGEHEISVHLSVDTHEELEDGDMVTITVEE